MSRSGVGRFLGGVACLAVVTSVAWLVALAVLPGVAGWRSVTLTSGSMAPAIRAGDVVVARPYRGGSLRPGSVRA